MKYFPTVKAALDESFAGICRHRNLKRDDACQVIRQHLATMSREWFSGETPNIAYEDPLCRFAYLYCHTAANANLCEVAIRSSTELDDFIQSKMSDDEELRVCAFGGGPGTELLALSKHLLREPRGGHARITFTLLDRVGEWSETWTALEGQINSELRSRFGSFSHPFSICKAFITHDLTRSYEYANHAHLFDQDLYFMNYVVSELIGDHDEFQALLTMAISASPSGCKFLVVDRDQDKVIQNSNALLESAGLILGPINKTCCNMDEDERKEDLEPYITYIGRWPRVQWGSHSNRGAFYVVGTKP
jgi:hypothetical protein